MAAPLNWVVMTDLTFQQCASFSVDCIESDARCRRLFKELASGVPENARFIGNERTTDFVKSRSGAPERVYVEAAGASKSGRVVQARNSRNS